MSRAFLFIKLKSKTGIRRLNVPRVKRVSTAFVLKRTSRKPFFIRPQLKLGKNSAAVLRERVKYGK